MKKKYSVAAVINKVGPSEKNCGIIVTEKKNLSKVSGSW